MHNHYKDIIERIPDPPLWFDEYGVPRYTPFAPGKLGYIHWRETALADISCQSCGRPFRVAIAGQRERSCSLSDDIRTNCLSRDPPNVWCCDSGPSMTAVVHNILEYWVRDEEFPFEWRRDPTFEGPLSEDEIEPPDIFAEAIDALSAGARTVRVLCTSGPNRGDISARVVSTKAADLRLLVASSMHEMSLHSLLTHHQVPDTIIESRRKQGQVILASFDEIKSVDLTNIGLIILLAAAQPRESWADAASHLAANAADKVRMEFALKHSVFMIEKPERVVGTF